MNEISLKLLYGNEGFQIRLDKDLSLIKLNFLKIRMPKFSEMLTTLL